MNEQYHIPKYQLIEKDILERIESGSLRPLYPLPSEKELCLQFLASRSTIRIALDHLSYAGKIFRVPGKGSFVALPKIDQNLSQFMGFSEKMKAQGFSVKTKLIKKDVIFADGEISAKLLLKPREKVIKIERLRLVEAQPMVLQLFFVPLSTCHVLLNEDLEAQSLRLLLEKKCGIRLHRSDLWVESFAPSRREKKLLGDPKASLFLMVEGVAYDINDVPVRHSKGIFRGDRIRLKISDFGVEFEPSASASRPVENMVLRR
jgi:GntR family transcriptional regulator